MTRRHRFNLIQVDNILFISWNDSSDPSGEEQRIEFYLPTRVARIYFYVSLHFAVCARNQDWCNVCVGVFVMWSPEAQRGVSSGVWVFVHGFVCVFVSNQYASQENKTGKKRAESVKMTEQNWEEWKGHRRKWSDKGWRGYMKWRINANAPEWEWKVEGDKETKTDKTKW